MLCTGLKCGFSALFFWRSLAWFWQPKHRTMGIFYWCRSHPRLASRRVAYISKWSDLASDQEQACLTETAENHQKTLLTIIAYPDCRFWGYGSSRPIKGPWTAVCQCSNRTKMTWGFILNDQWQWSDPALGTDLTLFISIAASRSSNYVV